MLTILALLLTFLAAVLVTVNIPTKKFAMASITLANVLIVAAMGVYARIVWDIVDFAETPGSSFGHRYGYSWGLVLAAFFLNLIGGMSLKVDSLPY